MKLPRTRSVALELTLLTIVVTVVLLSVFSWLTLRWQRSWLMDEVERGLSLASDTLHSALRFGMMQNRREEIRASIERVVQDTGIDHVRLIEHRGRVGLASDDASGLERLDKNHPACGNCHQAGERPIVNQESFRRSTLMEGNALRTFVPVVAEEGCITDSCHLSEKDSGVLGVIDVSMPLSQVQEALTSSTLRLAAASLAVIFLGGALLWLALARRFRRPMNELLKGIRRIAAGDLHHQVRSDSRDEFGELARSFNHMGGQLIAIQKGMIQSERLISMGKLAAGVAHEINTPLTGILAYAEDLKNDAVESDPRRKDYDVIIREALRCRKIVRDLLDFSRQGVPTIRPVRPGELIERAVDVVVKQEAFKNIRIETRIDEDLPEIQVDPIQIQQVLINLVINAQQAMPAGGTIQVVARRAEGNAVLEFLVQDEGEGIPPEARPRIFDPFFSTKGGKTDGLGLAVCHGIVQQHGGVIGFETNLGKGTTFRVVLPARGGGQGGSA